VSIFILIGIISIVNSISMRKEKGFRRDYEENVGILVFHEKLLSYG
jgi:hypothetical protein